MEKYGVNISEEMQDLLQKEATIMEKLSSLMSPIPGVKTAAQVHEERASQESALMKVRGQIAELQSFE